MGVHYWQGHPRCEGHFVMPSQNQQAMEARQTSTIGCSDPWINSTFPPSYELVDSQYRSRHQWTRNHPTEIVGVGS
ncbi:hypothetical protein TNCV_454901 [Trichonephila clavipes]|nr:hypothetical protein TNCV_454901 [Trichonephila clavipes]